jgi:hypothetical protein
MPQRFFPFHDVGLQANPFRTLTHDEWLTVTVMPREISQLLESEIGHLQFRGQKGCGKTTVLYSIEAHLRRAGRRVAYERVAEDADRFSKPIEGLEFFLLDEAQRLSPAERDRLLAVARGLCLIIGNHEDFTRQFYRRDLSLVTINLEGIIFTELAAILERRLAYFSLTGSPGYAFSASAVTFLTRRYSPDLRSAELFLYEYFQQLPPPGEINEHQLKAFASTTSD